MLIAPPRALKRTQYRVMFFDAGQTLFTPDPPIGERYAEVAGRYGLHVPPRDMEQAFQEEYARHAGQGGLSALSSNAAERLWWQNLARDLFARFGAVSCFEDCFDELYDVFAHAEAWKLYPEVDHVLAECSRRGVRMGIVSNWDSRLETICREMNLTPRFDFILYSAGAGVAKPNPEIFYQALAKAGVAPDEALHIGDSWRDDVQGACAAGLDVLWLQRRNARPAEGVAVIDSLAEVLNFC